MKEKVLENKTELIEIGKTGGEEKEDLTFVESLPCSRSCAKLYE